jgi:hypothetical protein
VEKPEEGREGVAAILTAVLQEAGGGAHRNAQEARAGVGGDLRIPDGLTRVKSLLMG